jgi:hypothetical protein
MEVLAAGASWRPGQKQGRELLLVLFAKEIVFADIDFGEFYELKSFIPVERCFTRRALTHAPPRHVVAIFHADVHHILDFNVDSFAAFGALD